MATDIMNHKATRELVGQQKKKIQGYEDREQPQEQQQQIVEAACQDSTKSSSVLPLAVTSDEGQDEFASTTGCTSRASDREESSVEAAHDGGRGTVEVRRHWWEDCLPHVVLLREALLSSAPDIAVLGPLHGCYSFYLIHLHNEVLSSSYARTMTLGANATRLESAFMWVGGWRPTSALVLVYSLMGIEIEDALQSVSAGRDVGAASSSSLLSPRQLAVMHSLQKHTQHAETKITKKLTLLQMLIGDQDMLEAILLDAASPVANDSSRFRQITEKRMSRFRRLVAQAEELRLHTLKNLLSLLTPIQAARCGVAVFETCFALRTMGSTILPSLPALTTTLHELLPALPPPALVGKALDDFGKLIVPDLSTSDGVQFSYSVPHTQSDEHLVPDLSPYNNSSDVTEHLVPDLSPYNNSSDVTLSQFDEPLVSDASSSSNILNVSNVLHDQADEGTILVPSCSNNSSSQVPPQDSTRDFDREDSLLPTILSLVDLRFYDGTDRMAPAKDKHPSKAGKFPEKITSNRLLLLSPASSDVTIQNCSLESSELGAYFEVRPMLQLASADEEETYQVQPGPSENGDVGGTCHLQVGKLDCDQPYEQSSRQMSAPCECAQQGSQSKEGS